MRFSGPSAAAQVLARAWLLAAAGALLLPPGARLGWWLPLHLALAGGAGTAVAGTLPLFAKTWAGAHDLPQRWSPLVLVTVGAAAVGAGHPLRITWMVAAGGAAYGLGALRLSLLVVEAWWAGSNRRHRVALLGYAGAATSLTLGVVLGALLGTGGVAADARAGVRQAHVTLTGEGFLALTVAASLLLMIPIVLRARAPQASGRVAILGLATGVLTQAVGLALGMRALAAAGALIVLLGAADLVRVAALAATRRPRRPEVVATLHLLAIPPWLLGIAAATFALILAGEPAWPLSLTAALALGVLVQALIGAWSYLLPVSDPGGAEARRERLEATRPWAVTRWAAFNGGAAAAVLATAGALPASVAPAGLSAAALSAVLSVTLASRRARPGRPAP